ncbi:ArsR family transcriptional regulator [Campylobacter fetus subsp. venerealis]|nr:ArsR family transcriptional regulator [Campylobacter fetus subsp. venerealis]PHJ04709.1 ArsR family transcriptional regulator [Campylobacter fetus subsp. venerealis]
MLTKLFKKILGEKKTLIMELLVENMDEKYLVKYTIKEICDELEVSKPTVIQTFKLLEEKGVLTKIKNGLYRLNLSDEL